MTIDISDLINTPRDEFEEKLDAFKKSHPEFFPKSVALVRIQHTPQVQHLQMMLNVGQILIDFDRGQGIMSITQEKE